MTYAEVTTSESNLYLIDWDLVDQVIHHSAYIQSINENAKLITEKEGFGMPETYEYDIDIERARSAAAAAVVADTARRGQWRPQDIFYQQSRLPTRLDVESLRLWLVSTEKAGRDAHDEYFAKQQKATHLSMTNINNRAAAFETAANVAKITRNLSTDFLLISAGALTGGAALAVGGAGSLIKGVGTYQDTHNIGAAVVDASFSFLSVLIPGPKSAASVLEKRLLIFVKAKTTAVGTFSVGLVEGKSVKESALSAVVDVVLDVGGEKATGKLLGKKMEKLLEEAVGHTAIPIGVAVKLTGAAASKQTAKFGADKGVEKIVELRKSEAAEGAGGLIGGIAVSHPSLARAAVLGPDAFTWPT
jgi:hypothetical protein